jgi:hypothetical protein
MKRLYSAGRVGLLCWCALTLAAGCAPEVKVEPVSGRVLVDGKPVTSGQVSLIPTTKEGGGGLSAGTIDESGTYKIFTAGKAGAPPGKYKVTVTPSMIPTGGKSMPTTPYHPMYRDAAKTPLTIEVPSSAPGSYDLKLTK